MYISFCWQSLNYFFPCTFSPRTSKLFLSKASFASPASSYNKNQNNIKHQISTSKMRFKGNFKTHSSLWCSSHCKLNETLMLQFLRVSGATFLLFQSISIWNLLCILKTKGLTKSHKNSARISAAASNTVIVLPFAKPKPTVLTTKEYLQADLC